ncbi:MAG: HAD family hydrolase [Treponema sp.]|nr:HAD family hydrolase [Treponema sp.]
MPEIKVAVFDLGGTLMEYKGMHLSWISCYKGAFDYVNDKLSLKLTETQIEKSIKILSDYNPRVRPREKEIAPEVIFADVTAEWNSEIPVTKIIDAFFESFHLEPLIYEDSIPTLQKLKDMGFKTAALTDVATGMPDKLHKYFVAPLLPYFDLYVSSLSCGYKKPNVKGLKDIADYFKVTPKEMIMTGDDLRDIQAAKNFGCQSVLIDRNDSKLHQGEVRNYGQTYTIDKIKELGDILSCAF